MAEQKSSELYDDQYGTSEGMSRRTHEKGRTIFPLFMLVFRIITPFTLTSLPLAFLFLSPPNPCFFSLSLPVFAVHLQIVRLSWVIHFVWLKDMDGHLELFLSEVSRSGEVFNKRHRS
jgi:hypothetical protein